MDQSDTSAGSEPSVDTVRAVVGRGRESVSKAAPYLRRGVGSGAAAAVVGGAGLFSGLRALLGGERERKRVLTRLAVGAGFLAAALAQRRSRGGGSDVEVPEGVDTGPDIDGVDTEPDIEPVDTGTDDEATDDEAGDEATDDEENHAAGRAVAEAADTFPDATGDETTTAETEAGADDTRTEDTDVDRLGEAAFDWQSREIPAPQRAFNRGFLAHSAEAFWGIRTRDDAVLVSQDYDAVQGRDGVQYVASSQIGEDVRALPIPDAVLNHWNEVLGGGTAVAGGDDILFVTTDDLAADGLLRVLPAEWDDDLSG